MPRPSYAQLRQLCATLELENASLRTHSPFNVTTRAGIPFELRRVEDQARYIVFLDVDDMHGANKRWGYETVNGKLKRALHVRSSDVLMRGLWFSGDEFVIILRGNPEEFMSRLRTAFKNVEMSATMASVVYSGDIDADVRTAAAIVQAHKEGYQR